MNPELWERAKILLAEAVDRPAADRERYVREHCTDPDLQREVLALLAAAPAPLSEIVSTGALRPGARVGAYVIEQRIGSGGMGEVYRARDSRLGRDVAIKVLPPLFAAEGDRLARFEREARLLASLNHPNICTLFDVGRDRGHERHRDGAAGGSNAGAANWRETVAGGRVAGPRATIQ